MLYKQICRSFLQLNRRGVSAHLQSSGSKKPGYTNVDSMIKGKIMQLITSLLVKAKDWIKSFVPNQYSKPKMIRKRRPFQLLEGKLLLNLDKGDLSDIVMNYEEYLGNTGEVSLYVASVWWECGALRFATIMVNLWQVYASKSCEIYWPTGVT